MEEEKIDLDWKAFSKGFYQVKRLDLDYLGGTRKENKLSDK